LPNKKVVLPVIAATVLVLMLWFAFRDSSGAPAAPRVQGPAAAAPAASAPGSRPRDKDS